MLIIYKPLLVLECCTVPLPQDSTYFIQAPETFVPPNVCRLFSSTFSGHLGTDEKKATEKYLPQCESDSEWLFLCLSVCSCRNIMDTCLLKSRQCQRGVSFLGAMFCSQWRAQTLNAIGSPTGWR